LFSGPINRNFMGCDRAMEMALLWALEIRY
jgi:hypothetical protein